MSDGFMDPRYRAGYRDGGGEDRVVAFNEEVVAVTRWGCSCCMPTEISPEQAAMAKKIADALNKAEEPPSGPRTLVAPQNARLRFDPPMRLEIDMITIDRVGLGGYRIDLRLGDTVLFSAMSPSTLDEVHL